MRATSGKKSWKKIFEPDDKAYHLGSLVSEIDVHEMSQILIPLLETADNAEPSFSDRVAEKKKMYPKTSKKPMSEIRRMVFEDIIESLGKSSEVWRKYYDWLNSIGDAVKNQLQSVLGEIPEEDKIYEFDLGDADSDTDGERVLHELFNPYKPYSLVIEEMTLISRPRKELIELNHEDYP